MKLVIVGLCHSESLSSRGIPLTEKYATSLLSSASRQEAQHLAYCACGGPHEGQENAQQFIHSSIDTVTTLYQIYRDLRPGTPGDIREKDGVVMIDELRPSPQNADLSLLPERIRDLIQRPSEARPRPFSQKDWPQLPEWIGTILEDARVFLGQTRASGTSAQALWLVAGIQDLQLKLDIHAETRVDDNGSLDEVRSCDAARDYLASILVSIERDPQEVWTQSSLNEYGEISVQYAENIPAGRVILISGNIVVDIRGASSSTALLPLVQTLLAHTTVEGPILRAVPSVSDYFFEVLETSRGDADHIVKGTDVEFLIHCIVDARIAVSNAHVTDYGILLSKYEVVDVEGENNSAIAFTFIARELGSHEVELYFSEWSTMVCGTKKITVEVVSDAGEGNN
ncbi:hypothetical protein ACEPAH_9218 [Sanghuangporus vaninii]